jgi:hypothetical protein
LSAVLVSWLGAPSSGLRYRSYARGYAIACALRLTLPDAMQSSWLWTSLLHWLGVVLLLANGCMAGWAACAVATLLPIVLLQDQLTQSGYLFACALAAVVIGARTKDRNAKLDDALPHAVRLLTVLVYAMAALHKLNRDFFDVTVSCANVGLGVLATGAETWLSPSVAGSFASPWWPRAFILAEMGIAALLLARPAIGVTVACAFHVPLTIIFAPGFAFTMMSGWLCFFDADELRALVRLARRRWWAIALVGGVPALLSRTLLFPGRWETDPDWCIKEVLLWMALAWMLEAVTARHRDGALVGRRAWHHALSPWAPRVIAALFVVNALTPYAGLQFHHTGAMLSNLRIDAGCSNSLLFPPPPDPYVRVDAIHFAEGRAVSGVAERITARLWGPEAIDGARAHWCSLHPEPLRVVGSYRGVPFDEADICHATAPWSPMGLRGMRRFQTNLTRACPQRCIH